MVGALSVQRRERARCRSGQDTERRAPQSGEPEAGGAEWPELGQEGTDGCGTSCPRRLDLSPTQAGQ